MFKLLSILILSASSLFGEMVTIYIHHEDKVVTKEYDRYSSVLLLKNDIKELFGIDHENQQLRFVTPSCSIVTKGGFWQYGITHQAHAFVTYMCKQFSDYTVPLRFQCHDLDISDFEIKVPVTMLVADLWNELESRIGRHIYQLSAHDRRMLEGNGLISLEKDFSIQDYLLSWHDEVHMRLEPFEDD